MQSTMTRNRLADDSIVTLFFGMGKFVGRRTEDGCSVNTALAHDF